ncbi:suppression of tumorigenicity 5 [Limosa lapponica baueri]|uniref:Suppression of tumorigenicity 5 n=1 Tax=Limosa lapponica baueri TaxID=1758121 RepID=A0A2I0T4X1_LIMLA|nr:suppression of tumorigenicity 5 [Limosa lapponica baueri]
MVAELQETVKRLRSIRGAKTEIDRWFQNNIPAVATTENEAPAAHSRHGKKQQRVLLVGDSLLKGTKVPICHPDRASYKVCCLLGTKVRDVADRVPQTVKNTDYYPLLLFHVGMNDTASQNLGRIKEDYKALGVQVKKIGAQVSSILPVRGKGTARNEQIMHINSWLHGWCHCEGFGFYDNGTFFDDYGLLERDEIHLSRRGKGIFGSRLANLMKRALN